MREDWSELGFNTVESGPWEAVVAGAVDGSDLIEWVKTNAGELADEGGGRGRRNRFFESPDGDRWFLKQYHHGGVLAEEGDVVYETPDRFYDELRASLRADRNGVNVPEPIGVFVRHDERGVEGFYVSRAVEGTLLSRAVRLRDQPELLEQAGRVLARLHDAGIDHRDYHLKNCLVSGDDEVIVTDFDPVDFRAVGDWKRSLRVHRFNRSLDKYGFRSSDAEWFVEGYESIQSLNTFYQSVQSPFLAVKDFISDCRYALTGDRRWEEIDREKILVRVPNWLGDGVMCLPFLQCLNDDPATGRVDVAVRSALSELFRRSPAVDHVHEIEGGKTYRLPEQISHERYSTAVTIPKSYRTAVQLFRSGIPRRLGFNRGGRGLFLTDRVPLDNRDREIHHATLYLELIERLVETPGDVPAPTLDVPESVRSETRDRFDLPDRYITIHPGSAYGPAKRWPADQFNELITKIIEKETTVVALGVASEQSVADEVLRGLPDGRVMDLVGETSLEECMAVLKASSGTIANDSGIMHLSAALETPTVGIFGSSNPDLTTPIGPHRRVLYEDVDCSPCFERECPLDEDRYKCLTRIDSTEVYETLQDLVNDGLPLD